MNTNSPIYFHTCVTAAAFASTTGGELANNEKIIQERTIIAPSKHTAQYDLRKLLPIFCVGSPAKDESGIGAIAVYRYNLKNRPYTVIIIMKDNTVINNPPINVTAHNGMDSKKPHFSTAVIIDCGKVVLVAPPNPEAVIIVDITPCTIFNLTNICITI